MTCPQTAAGDPTKHAQLPGPLFDTAHDTFVVSLARVSWLLYSRCVWLHALSGTHSVKSFLDSRSPQPTYPPPRSATRQRTRRDDIRGFSVLQQRESTHHHDNVYVCICMCIYIYIYIYILSASWKLPGHFCMVSVVDITQRFRMVSVVGCFMVSVAAGNVFLWFPSLVF